MLLNVLKAFLIGICASAPLGPIAILVLQKSLSYGRRAGFVTGLGATTIDTTYATISIFALAVAQSFLYKYEYYIYLIGGPIIALLGLTMAFHDPFRNMKSLSDERGASIKDYLSAVVTAVSNPGAGLMMFALFAFFRIDVISKGITVFPIILGVAGGSISYWYCFSLLFSKIRKAINLKLLVWLSRVAGIIVLIIGIALVGEGAFRLLFHGAAIN